MSTQIKKNGNWVTVAGGTRMWVGTKAALQAALNAGELEDGTAVMVTDDYNEGDIEKTFFTPTPSSGAVVANDCWYVRKGNVVTINIGIASMTASAPGETVFTLPVGLRPCGQRVLFTGNNNNYAADCNIQITQNGAINIVCTSGCFGTITYITED